MATQLHKRYSNDQVKSFLERYLHREINLDYFLDILGIKRRRFFELLRKYRMAPEEFSISYRREGSPRRIPAEIELNILKELQVEKSFVKDKAIPLKSYNSSYIKDLLWTKYRQKASLPPILTGRRDITSIFLSARENLMIVKF